MPRFPICVLAAMTLAVSDAGAHTRSQSHSVWEIKGADVDLVMTIPVVEADRLSGEQSAGDQGAPSDDRLKAYLSERVYPLSGGKRCPVVPPIQTLSAAPGFRKFDFTFKCAAASNLQVHSAAFFDLVPSHTNFAQVQNASSGEFTEQLITAEHRTVDVTGGEGNRLKSARFVEFIRMGTMHIFTGVDHMSFLLGLVLISRRLRDLVFVVTGFTIGHSLTLALAVTGVLRPHAEYIDALVALTIALIGAENIVVQTQKPTLVALAVGGSLALMAWLEALGMGGLPSLLLLGAGLFTANYLMISGRLRDAGRLRILITLVFGLIHGFGFAADLLELQLPPERLAELLVGFNVGVEIGQLILVAGAALLVATLARTRMALPRRLVVDVASSFLVGLGVFWFVSRSYASDTTLEPVTVTAKRLEETLPQQLAAYGTRVDTISAEDIKNGAFVDVAETLQALAPGLSISSKNGPFDYVDISLLGSRTEDVLWLVDGVRINNRLYSGTTPLDTIPVAVAERVEVMEGGQALFYGTQAVAGAINIVTKDFSDRRDGQFTVGADSLNGRHADGYARDSIGANHFVIYGSSDNSSGYRAFRPQDYQPSNTDRDRGYGVTTIGGKYAYDFTPGLRSTIFYQHTDANLDFAMPFRVARDVNSRKEDLGTMKLDYDVSDKISWYLKAYYHEWSTHYDTYYTNLANPGTLDVLYQDAFWGYRDYGVNALVKLAPNRGFEYYAGYDMQRYNGRDEVLVIEQQTATTNAVFGQVRTTHDLLGNAAFALGARYNKPTSGEQAAIWNASGRYDFSSGLFVRGTVGTNFRLPDAEQLYANDPLDERGNPNLKPERSRSANLSLGAKSNAFGYTIAWELIGFARNISDLIDYASFDPVTNQDVFGNVPGTVTVRGGEAVLSAAFNDVWSADFSYTYSHSREPDSEQQLLRVPETLIKAALDFHPTTLPVGGGINVRYTGADYTNVGGAIVNYGNFLVVDLLGRWFLDEERHHRVTVDVYNVFDEQYGRPAQGCADTPADGPYDCSLPYTYVNRGLPRMFRASYTFKF